MIMKVYSLFDKKVGIHSLPMFFNHDAYFFRAISELVADPSTSIGKHPSDYDMHVLAEFDDQTGVFNSTPGGIRSLGSCLSLLPARADTIHNQVSLDGHGDVQ